MKTLVKILAVSTLLALAACKPTSTTTSVANADAYVLLFLVHTSNPEIQAEQAYGLGVRPSILPTLAACQEIKDKLVASFNDEDAKAWFVDKQIDKKTVVCAPVNF